MTLESMEDSTTPAGCYNGYTIKRVFGGSHLGSLNFHGRDPAFAVWRTSCRGLYSTRLAAAYLMKTV